MKRCFRADGAGTPFRISVPAAVVLAVLLAACRSTSPSVCRLDVPFLEQSEGRCGTAAVAMVLRFHGADPDMDELDRDIHLPALEGSIPALLVEGARTQGWAADAFRCSEEEFRRFLADGVPLIVLLAPSGRDPRGHFVVATGFNFRTGALRVHSGSRSHQWWKASKWRPPWEAAGCRVVWIRPEEGGPRNLQPASGRSMGGK
ncbi:MAG: hypothetical protein GX548_11580 [Lentisphaerae bacterium]|nr:hypothetical protein [Lentisphaerota bacterium]